MILTTAVLHAQEESAAGDSLNGVVTSQSQLLVGPQAMGHMGDVRMGNDQASYIFSAPDHAMYNQSTGGALIDITLGDNGLDLLGEIRTSYGPNLTRRAIPESVSLSDDQMAVTVVGEDLVHSDITVSTEYRISTDFRGLSITTAITNGTDEMLEGWSIGDAARWGATQLFMMDRGQIFTSQGRFTGRAAVAYGDGMCMALTLGEGRSIIAQLDRECMRLIADTYDIASGETVVCSRSLLIGEESMSSISHDLWRLLGVETGTLRGEVVEQTTSNRIAGAEVLLSERTNPPLPLLRVVTDEEGQFEVELPANVRIVGFPRSWNRSVPTQLAYPLELQPGGEAAAQYQLTPPAQVLLRVTDEDTGELLPARVAIYDLRGMPADLGPIDSGESSGPYIYAVDGEGTFEVPNGQFHMTVSHGPEYSRYERDVIFIAGYTREFPVELKHLVDTPGYVAADLGVLTNFSQEAIVSPVDRVRTAVCEDLEFLVSTDSGHVTDLAAAVEEAGESYPITMAMGERIHSPEDAELGTWSVFPLPPDTVGESALPSGDYTDHSQFLAAVRERFPQALIANIFPAVGDRNLYTSLGYEFSMAHRAWMRDEPLTNAQADFDLMEVFGGKDMNQHALDMAIYNRLLQEGHRIIAVGSSNSRYGALEEIGHPRTYIAADDSDPANIDPDEVFASLRAGNAFVTTGPWIEFSIFDGEYQMGDMLPWERGEPVEVSLRVSCPGWMGVSSIDICKEGQFVRRDNMVIENNARVFDWTLSDENSRFMVRHDQIFTVAVRGRHALSPMNPANPMSQPLLPIAISNPIWVDTDGNGRFDNFE